MADSKDEINQKQQAQEMRAGKPEPRPAEAPAAAESAGAKPAPQFIAEHTLAADETLSHLAQKYYGHATPPYWTLIYEANKDVIGDNPNHVRAGMLVKIPALPDALKK
jgi:nucleoid-associated protein YgaU